MSAHSVQHISMKKVFALCFILSACGSPKPVAVPGSEAWLNEQDLETRGEYYNDLCVGQGFIAGSEEFYNCVQDASANLKLYQLRADFADRALR